MSDKESSADGYQYFWKDSNKAVTVLYRGLPVMHMSEWNSQFCGQLFWRRNGKVRMGKKFVSPGFGKRSSVSPVLLY